MPQPKVVFENPDQYWSFITSKSPEDFEGQYFDRKEAGRLDDGRLSSSQMTRLKDQITECVSAFANANREGGLLVLGISDSGEVKGLRHLDESKLNEITNINSFLRAQAAVVRQHECSNEGGEADSVLLIFVPYAENAICETLSNPSRAWLRNGRQNLPIDERMREHLKRDKRITDFERAHCCPFHLDDVDRDVLAEFRKSYLKNASYEYDDIQLLYHIGAIDREPNEQNYYFNNAGYLFFARNPQRQIAWAYIRLLRFEAEATVSNKGLPSLPEKQFDGPLAQQIRKIRTYFRESAFFKTYQRRNPDGGFIDDPEFPPIAVDEAIVNAVAHRDYAAQLPIECIHYKDALVVENPGSIQQRDRNLPADFSLDDVELDSMPRNSKLIEWLKCLGDERGAEFVRAIREGTKRMRGEMLSAGLPAPKYHTGHTRTIVTLFNNADVRETLLRLEGAAQTPQEYTNLFHLQFFDQQGAPSSLDEHNIQHKDFLTLLNDALAAHGWYVDRFRFGRIVAHLRGLEIPLSGPVVRFLRFYPAYAFELHRLGSHHYLSIDYTLEVKNILRLNQLLQWLEPSELASVRVVARFDNWQSGRLLRCDNERATVYFYELDREERVTTERVIPDLPIHLLKLALNRAKIPFDLSSQIKRHSLSAEPNSARIRAEKTVATAGDLFHRLFPLSMGTLTAVLSQQPESLYRQDRANSLQIRTISEPSVEFSHSGESANIRQGITQYGSYEDAKKTIELVPICIESMREDMAQLIERLKVGSQRYRGSERTFSTRFTYSTIVTVTSSEAILAECERLLKEHPSWSGNPHLDRLFLIYTPEANYALDDENAPYYRVKRFLLEHGVPCQMVDTPTLRNPDWKDLNLALNITAKCGVTPWVLPDKIPDADFFIGLSYTETHKRGRRRLVGYSTVFNQFGRWEFFLGNTDAFSYEDRTKYFAELTRRTLTRLELGERPSVFFHYSARYSREDRDEIAKAARSVRPKGIFHFVSVTSAHNFRLYDSRGESDGSVSRGSYVVTRDNQILLSTTGYNPFRKALGTPKPLQVTITSDYPEGLSGVKPDLKSLAVQILSLTKLNWASTDSICGEPITTKYAGDIAYLTDAFLRQTGSFRLHSVLERTPWFI